MHRHTRKDTQITQNTLANTLTHTYTHKPTQNTHTHEHSVLPNSYAHFTFLNSNHHNLQTITLRIAPTFWTSIFIVVQKKSMKNSAAPAVVNLGWDGTPHGAIIQRSLAALTSSTKDLNGGERSFNGLWWRAGKGDEDNNAQPFISVFRGRHIF